MRRQQLLLVALAYLGAALIGIVTARIPFSSEIQERKPSTALEEGVQALIGDPELKSKAYASYELQCIPDKNWAKSLRPGACYTPIKPIHAYKNKAGTAALLWDNCCGLEFYDGEGCPGEEQNPYLVGDLDKDFKVCHKLSDAGLGAKKSVKFVCHGDPETCIF